MSINTSINGNRNKVKIVMLGDQSVGKTSIIQKFVHNKFEEVAYPTVGIDFLAKDFIYKNEKVRLQLWDTAGQERFRSLIPFYLRDSSCAIIVFDLTNKQSYENIDSWLNMYRQNRGHVPVAILAGNKSDASGRICQFEDVDKRAKQLGIKYIQVSAKIGKNLEQLFLMCLNQIRSAPISQSTSFKQFQQIQSPSPFQTMKSVQALQKFALKDEKVQVTPDKKCRC